MPPSYGPSTSHSNADVVLDEIRDVRRLKHLRLRPRNLDGTLDLRCKVNKGFKKDEEVSDYFSPK